MRNSFQSMMLALLAGLFLASSVMAQGVFIDVGRDRVRLPRPIISPPPFPRPRPLPPSPSSYKIKELAVNVNLADQVAKVQLSQTFVNTGSRQMEVVFVYPLPHDGAVDSLTFLVDGKEYEARMLEAKEARSIYEGYVRRNQDPALMEWIGTGMFKTSVFPVPPGAERQVMLRYTQLCRKTKGLTDFVFPLSTAKYTSKAVEKVSFRINIQSGAKIKNVYSPSHQVSIDRPGNVQAIVNYEAENQVPTDDFRLLYDVGESTVGASVLSYRPEGSNEGYFLLMMSPEIKRETEKVTRKTVICVVDRSGSMSGKKMEQARGALKSVINNLRDGDLFNVVAYDSKVESFRPELQKFDDDTRKAALGFVEGIYAGGSTNIDGALKVALGQLKDNKQPSYVIFLTDGLPTQGETKELQIVKNAQQSNQVRARIFTFGVGYDVNSRLLDRLARECFGQSEYVRPKENIEEAVSNLYSRIGTPVMTDVAVSWDAEGWTPEQGSMVSRVYPKNVSDLFAGDQLVLAGRFKKSGAAKVVVTGKIDGKETSIDFPAHLVESSADESYAFVEKLWAVRRVGEIVDDIDLHGKNPELIDELVSLSTRHGILTPYTAFLAEEPVPGGGRLPPQPVPLARRRAQAEAALKGLADEDGVDAFELRADKARFSRANSPAVASAPMKKDAKGKRVRVTSIKNVGRKTFYQRGDMWVDSTIKPEELKTATKVERFSKEYFDLAAKHKDAAKYLAIEGKVVLRLGKTVYEF